MASTESFQLVSSIASGSNQPSLDEGAARPDSADEDCECAFCDECYCQDGKEWIRCAAAAGFTKSVYKTFTLMETVKSDFVYSVTTNSHHNFLPFFLIVCKNGVECIKYSWFL